jgi:hypothetical protein
MNWAALCTHGMLERAQLMGAVTGALQLLEEVHGDATKG